MATQDRLKTASSAHANLVLVTDALSYAGPGVMSVMLDQGTTVLCADEAFTDERARRTFEQQHPGAYALLNQEPEDVVREASDRWGQCDAVVLNHAHPNAPEPVEDITPARMQAGFDALVMRPIRLAQAVLPGMKARRRGSLIFITSARDARPEPGFALATTLRAATTAFATALAREAAPFGVQANVVAPNYLYSEAYYPRARFIDDPDGRAEIAATVPFGRLGSPEELGALVAFLAAGQSAFTTGQVIRFSGGWT